MDASTLGACDAEFVKGKHPTFVDLLVVVPTALDPIYFKESVQYVLNIGGFACIAGSRSGTTIRRQFGGLRCTYEAHAR